MGLDLQYDLSNDTPADASPVESNFNRIEQFTNLELINRSGTVSMTGQLKLLGNPIADHDAAPKDYVDGMMPIGAILMYGGASAPAGTRWMLCNGAELDPAQYPDLYNKIGTTYGGTGGKFNLPNLTTRFPVGTGTNYAMGATGGSPNAVIVTHTHTINHDHPARTTSTQSASHTHAISGTTSNANVNHSHAVPDGTALVKAFGAQYFTTGASGFQYSTIQHNTEGSAHTHTFSDTSSTQSANHTHTVDLVTYTGTSGNPSPAGVSATNANLPPYIVVQFIIRAS